MSKTKKVVGKGAITGAVVAPIAGQAALTAAGFTSSGIAAGSIAAGAQSAIGSVAAGSWFAGLQSIGATSALLGPLGLAVGAVGAVVGVGYGIYKLIDEEEKEASKEKDSKKDEEKEKPQKKGWLDLLFYDLDKYLKNQKTTIKASNLRLTHWKNYL